MFLAIDGDRDQLIAIERQDWDLKFHKVHLIKEDDLKQSFCYINSPQLKDQKPNSVDVGKIKYNITNFCLSTGITGVSFKRSRYIWFSETIALIFSPAGSIRNWLDWSTLKFFYLKPFLVYISWRNLGVKAGSVTYVHILILQFFEIFILYTRGILNEQNGVKNMAPVVGISWKVR